MEIKEYCSKLQNWEQENQKKVITDTLKRIQTLGKAQEKKPVLKHLEHLLKFMNAFHTSINTAESEKIDEVWFEQLLKAKSVVKQLIADIAKSKIKVPKLIKADSQIQYPQQQMKQKSKQYVVVMKGLFKNFLINFDQDFAKKKNREIIDFVHKVAVSLLEEFKIPIQSEKDGDSNVKGISQMMSRLEKIYNQLSKNQTTMAKKQMLQGMVEPERIAKFELAAFVSVQEQRLRQQTKEALVLQNTTGFYDNLKKNINKDANEQCKRCHKLAAYCEGQKQIRAADEPMTRFMVCNDCGSRWRQE